MATKSAGRKHVTKGVGEAVDSPAKRAADSVPGDVMGESRGKPARSGMIRARVDPALKAQAEAIFEAVGLNASDAIRLFYSQVALHQGLPFEVKIPNAETRKAMRDADAGKGIAYASAEEMFEEMGI